MCMKMYAVPLILLARFLILYGDTIIYSAFQFLFSPFLYKEKKTVLHYGNDRRLQFQYGIVHVELV